MLNKKAMSVGIGFQTLCCPQSAIYTESMGATLREMLNVEDLCLAPQRECLVIPAMYLQPRRHLFLASASGMLEPHLLVAHLKVNQDVLF